MTTCSTGRADLLARGHKRGIMPRTNFASVAQLANSEYA